MNRIKIIALTLSLLILAGCTTNPATGERELNRAGVGAAVGLVAGGLIGAAIGDHRAAYAGAALGAAIGGGTGYWMEQNKQRLEADLHGTGIAVTAETDKATGQQVLVLQAPSDVTFAPGSAEVSSTGYLGLARAANSLRGAPGIAVEVIGHTDNRGTAEMNQQLSQSRAENVASFLTSAGVPPASVRAHGMSFSSPVASNESAAGRAQNRRVEIRVSSNQQQGDLAVSTAY